MTTRLIEVLDPTAKAASVQSEIASRIDDLNGKVIGFLDNGKPNFDIFLARLEELLSQRFKLADVMHATKGEHGAGVPLAADQMEKLVAKCSVVVNGMCD